MEAILIPATKQYAVFPVEEFYQYRHRFLVKKSASTILSLHFSRRNFPVSVVSDNLAKMNRQAPAHHEYRSWRRYDAGAVGGERQLGPDFSAPNW